MSKDYSIIKKVEEASKNGTLEKIIPKNKLLQKDFNNSLLEQIAFQRLKDKLRLPTIYNPDEASEFILSKVSRDLYNVDDQVSDNK